jgi:hypothetical protein
MPCFVLLYHDCPPNYERPSHWDFMFETGDVLRTWALEQLPRGWQSAYSRTIASYPNCPALSVDNSVAALQLSDHRRDYLQLEGPLSGGRGTVVRVASGAYRSESQCSDSWRIVLASTELSARVSLSRVDDDDEHWNLTCS